MGEENEFDTCAHFLGLLVAESLEFNDTVRFLKLTRGREAVPEEKNKEGKVVKKAVTKLEALARVEVSESTAEIANAALEVLAYTEESTGGGDYYATRSYSLPGNFRKIIGDLVERPTAARKTVEAIRSNPNARFGRKTQRRRT